jgi:leucyl aminopeptidase
MASTGPHHIVAPAFAPEITFVDADSARSRARLLLVCEGQRSAIDRSLFPTIEARIADLIGAGCAGHGSVTELPVPAGAPFDRLLLLALGPAKDVSGPVVERAAHALVAHAAKALLPELAVDVRAIADCPMPAEALARHLAFGVLAAAYRFDRYKTLPAAAPPTLALVELVVDDVAAAEQAFCPLVALARGVRTARDLTNMPGNLLPPLVLAEAARALEPLGVAVEVLDEAAMRSLGMHALLSVGAGSAQPSALIVLRLCRGPDHEAPPIALVGKGVCFDSGGLSIKKAQGQEAMKMDMAGAAAVIGAIEALALGHAAVDVVAVIAAVENMPDGAAQRPGDVVTSMAGLTIETVNTDFEGRVILADALHYAIARFAPSHIIDIATLTGSVATALGDRYAGLFTYDDALAEALIAAGASGDQVWRLPVDSGHAETMRSDVADLRNYPGTLAAGASTAAAFLGYFVGETPWAHIDIGGVAWKTGERSAMATGYGVRLLHDLVLRLSGVG